MMPDTLPDRSEVAQFDQSKLKHVETQKKEVLPTKSGLLQKVILNLGLPTVPQIKSLQKNPM